jgi:hypothetical protein
MCWRRCARNGRTSRGWSLVAIVAPRFEPGLGVVLRAVPLPVRVGLGCLLVALAESGGAKQVAKWHGLEHVPPHCTRY